MLNDFHHNFHLETCTHILNETYSWLRIDLRRRYYVKELFISNHDHGNDLDMREFEVRVGDSLENNGNNNSVCCLENTIRQSQIRTVVCGNNSVGRYVNIRASKVQLALCEVTVIGVGKI